MTHDVASEYMILTLDCRLRKMIIVPSNVLGYFLQVAFYDHPIVPSNVPLTSDEWSYLPTNGMASAILKERRSTKTTNSEWVISLLVARSTKCISHHTLFFKVQILFKRKHFRTLCIHSYMSHYKVKAKCLFKTFLSNTDRKSTRLN